MDSNNNIIKPGRPKGHTDSELKEIALKIKYKYKGQKITALFLEQQTGIGRNTWSRRLKGFLQELNDPVLRAIPINDLDGVFLPNIEMIFEEHGDNKSRLIKELYPLETMIESLYAELKILKVENEKLKNYKNEAIKYKQQFKEQLQKAKYYEELYNTTVASSLYPHLHSKSPLLKDLNINESLINIKEDSDKHLKFKNLKLDIKEINISEEATSFEKDDKENDVMNFLKNEFDL